MHKTHGPSDYIFLPCVKENFVDTSISVRLYIQDHINKQGIKGKFSDIENYLVVYVFHTVQNMIVLVRQDGRQQGYEYLPLSEEIENAVREKIKTKDKTLSSFATFSFDKETEKKVLESFKKKK